MRLVSGVVSCVVLAAICGCGSSASGDDAGAAAASAWDGTWGGPAGSFTTASRVAVDAAGNAYVIGSFGPTADLDPSADVVSKTAKDPAPGTNRPARDAYLMKLDERHRVAWVRTWGGTGYDYATDVEVDAQGDVLVTGYFLSDSASVTFDPPAAGFEARGASWLETAPKAYVLKYDRDGTFQWARAWGSDASTMDAVRATTVALGVTSDADGNVYVAGDYEGADDFDGTEGTDVRNAADGGIYLASYTLAGTYRWVRTFGKGQAESLSSDRAGGIVMTGYAIDTADWDPSAAALPHGQPGDQDAFTARFATDGALRWCRFVEGTVEANSGRSVVADAAGRVYVIGGFTGTATFDGPNGSDVRHAIGATDVFLIEYAVDGSYVRGTAFGGAGNDVGLALALDGDGGLALTGTFGDVVDFDPGGPSAVRTATPSSFFVGRFGAGGSLVGLTTAGPAVGGGGYAIALDREARFYVAGTFWGTAELEAAGGIDRRTSVGRTDAFLWYLAVPNISTGPGAEP